MGLFDIFGSYGKKELKKIAPTVKRVLDLEDEYRALSDAELKGKTEAFKKRLSEGETLNDILPEAFATVREAADRVLGMRHFPCQIIGGVILHQGRIENRRRQNLCGHSSDLSQRAFRKRRSYCYRK